MAMSGPASSAPTGAGWALPTLQDILADVAPPPWTQTAFMAYLSQNHCLETLEFTMEAERYRNAYHDVSQTPDAEAQHATDHLSSLWQRLIHAYIQPYAYREVNLPSHVRDHLLSLPYSPMPPHPAELDGAVRIIYDLMNDSVLIPFLESACPMPDYQTETETETQEPRHARSRTRLPKDSQALSAESRRSPKSSPLLAQLGLPRRSEAVGRSASSSTDAADHGDLTDDSGVNSPPALEPMTPPTTPPTSDWGFATSPGTLQKAISGRNSGWKKVGAKLGFSRKSRAARGANASGARASAAHGDSDTSDSHSDNPPL